MSRREDDHGGIPTLSPPEVTAELLQRYDRPGPRYTSYPTALQFHDGANLGAYGEHLERASRVAEPLSFYIHLPFCEERCWFCGCNVVITKKRDVSERYLGLLEREIRTLAGRLGERRTLRQYHWGGGTPTYLAPDEMVRLHEVVRSEFRFEDDAEIAIEVDPRVTTQEHLETLRALGFNRLSMGVQDFAPEVQEAVHRIQPFELTKDLVDRARELGFDSINLDLIYGLPHQTPERFGETVRQVLEIRPERLAVYSFALVPWMKGHQRRLEQEALPDPTTKLELYATAFRAFTGGGYVPVGMDHFALPDDELVTGNLWRNFMGYTVRSAPDMVACGVSGIGDVAGGFFQNHRKLIDWERAVEGDGLSVARGYVMSEDDKIRREVITSLMCTFRLDVPALEQRFSIRFAEYFAKERPQLEALERDGMLHLADDAIEVRGHGRLFVRNVCMVFDAYLDPNTQRYSRTV